jgi:hypothetical protein
MAFCVVTQCGLAPGYQCFRGTYYLHAQGTLTMETAHSFEMLGPIFRTTKGHNLENHNIKLGVGTQVGNSASLSLLE